MLMTPRTGRLQEQHNGGRRQYPTGTKKSLLMGSGLVRLHWLI